MNRIAKVIDCMARCAAFAIHLLAGIGIMFFLWFIGIIITVFFIGHRDVVHIGTAITTALAVLILGLTIVLMIWFWKALKRYIYPDTGPDHSVPSGRVRGAFKGVIAGFALVIILQAAVSIITLNAYSAAVCGMGALCIFLGIVLLCTVSGICFPVQKDRPGKGWLITGVLLILPLWLFCNILIALAPMDGHYTGYTECKYAIGEELTRKILPPNAENISVKYDETMLMFCHFNWSCSVSEQDFLEFAKSNGYELAENDPCHNVNPETNDVEIYYVGILYQFFGDKIPESDYYFYSYVYANHGGWIMLYDRKAQVLYGHYSSH